ncbi:hypothetical protein [Noviherbaspirillum massiliense]|uniref:hypothetical protein n=1 Tax=Noviherbaspirillum massiliense TaxID=1465823 RepID=UPI0003698786|nr:hypothetical protein [Noviherbaspirillum massiliense]
MIKWKAGEAWAGLPRELPQYYSSFGFFRSLPLEEAKELMRQAHVALPHAFAFYQAN